jgi:hypothetical protein
MILNTSSQQEKSTRKKGNKQAPPSSLTGGANVQKNILTGIDTIEINYDVVEWGLTEQDWIMLDRYKQLARSTTNKNDMANIKLAGTYFEVQRVGTAHYEYILKNGDMTLELHREIKDGKYFPLLRARLSSEFLWSVNYLNALDKLNQFVNEICCIKSSQISRVDLTADFEGPVPDWLPKQFVTFARIKRVKTEIPVDINYNGLNLTGFNIGKGDIYLTIYDKTQEIKKSHKEWFMDAWRINGWIEGNPVTRYEFQIRRGALKELGINTIGDLLNKLAGIWEYCTTKWITIRDIGKGIFRRRWKLNEMWKAIQEVTFGSLTHLERLRVRKCAIDALKNSAYGFLKSIGAYNVVSMHYAPELAVYIVKRWLNEILETDDFKIEILDRAFKYSELVTGVY